MAKTKIILKEIGIVILLLIVVALLLAIIFYDYIPNNKTVPIKVQAYELSEEIQEELKESVLNEQNIVRTYYIDSSDLNVYEATNDYDKGKANPFADYTENTTSNSTESNNTTNSTTNSVTTNDDNDAQEDTNQNEVYVTSPGKNY